MSKKKDWFKLKRYPHLDKQIQYWEREAWVEAYVTTPNIIADHSFLPFIHKTKTVRKFRKQYSKADGFSLKAKGKALRKADVKKRDLYYASHLDSLIYSYYAQLLAERYEEKVKALNLYEVVLAYRSIPIYPNDKNSKNKCNIDFANDAFEFIAKYPHEHFVAIAFDITSFFDNLNHSKLCKAWMKLLEIPEESKLPPDHFNVFKSITRFSYVDLIDVFKLYQNKIIVQDRSTSDKPRTPRRKRISKLKFLKKQNAIAFCKKAEFLRDKSKLVRNKKFIKNEQGEKVLRSFGIPQGTPISSVLANAYLMNFDKIINESIHSLGGRYWRYSDDMLVICPTKHKDYVKELFDRYIQDEKLTIQTHKTQVFHFEQRDGVLRSGQEFKNGFINWNKNLTYLGFDFDGTTTLLKPGSLAVYYRKMKRTIACAKRFKKMKGPNQGEIFKRRILDRYSYKGAQRKRVWIKDESINGFVKSDRYNWGNFLAYTKKAEKILTTNKIRSQTKKHWHNLVKELKRN